MTLSAPHRESASPALLDLAEALLAHLEAEIVLLDELHTASAALHAALRRTAPLEIEAARDRQLALDERLDAIRATRAGLIQLAAAILGAPLAAVTVRAVASRLPQALAQRLDEARERARDRAQRVDSLNRRNAALARHGLAYVQERLDQFSHEPAAGRYRADGKALNAPRGSFIEVQG